MGLGQHALDYATTSIAFYNNRYFDEYRGPISEIPKFKIDKGLEETDSITIGHDVWIGENVIFSGDVNVGHGSIIGAGTIVTKDIPPYSVVVNRNGHGEVIKSRFSDEICADLLQINWWDYNLPPIQSAIEVLIRKLNNQPPFASYSSLNATYSRLSPEDQQNFIARIENNAMQTFYKSFGIDKVSKQDLLELRIPYEDPKLFVDYLKKHDLSRFQKIDELPKFHFYLLSNSALHFQQL